MAYCNDRNDFYLPGIHLLEYPMATEECRSTHGLAGYGPMHMNQSGYVVCAACGTLVYGLGNPPDLAGKAMNVTFDVDSPESAG